MSQKSISKKYNDWKKNKLAIEFLKENDILQEYYNNRVLNIINLELEYIPSFLSILNPVSIIATNNYIKEFPTETLEIKDLQNITLDNNLIEEIPVDLILKKAKGPLKQIRLDYNYISERRIDELNSELGDNKIRFISGSEFNFADPYSGTINDYTGTDINFDPNGTTGTNSNITTSGGDLATKRWIATDTSHIF